MLLEKKNAIIYGAGGAIGGAVARAFAREGAKVFLAGRTLASLEAVAKDISNAGGVAEITQVDAFDQRAIENYLGEVVRTAGRIDISFNAVGLGDTQGMPLVEMEQESFALPVMNAIATHFLTATAAARHMRKNGSGVILAITARAVMGYPNVGGFGVACAAIEGFCRQLAAEAGPPWGPGGCVGSARSPDAPRAGEGVPPTVKDAGRRREALGGT